MGNCSAAAEVSSRKREFCSQVKEGRDEALARIDNVRGFRGLRETAIELCSRLNEQREN